MSEKSRDSISVYRLLPSLNDLRTLGLDMGSGVKLAKWARSGSETDRPTTVNAHWVGEPEMRAAEFPSIKPYGPILSRRLADLLADELATAGSFVPVHIEGGESDYLLYLVEAVVDCLDTRRSSKPRKSGDPLTKASFRTEAVPTHLPAFRVPDSPRAVYWNCWAVEQLTKHLGEDLEARLIWSNDPARTPHSNPWGVV